MHNLFLHSSSFEGGTSYICKHFTFGVFIDTTQLKALRVSQERSKTLFINKQNRYTVKWTALFPCFKPSEGCVWGKMLTSKIIATRRCCFHIPILLKASFLLGWNNIYTYLSSREYLVCDQEIAGVVFCGCLKLDVLIYRFKSNGHHTCIKNMIKHVILKQHWWGFLFQITVNATMVWSPMAMFHHGSQSGYLMSLPEAIEDAYW